MHKPNIFIEDSWTVLRSYTKARIALGRCGSSIPTKELLSFKLAHAKAIDAVHLPLNTDKIMEDIERISGEKVIRVHSAASDRFVYLKRPDLGRVLCKDSMEVLKSVPKKEMYHIGLVVSDGLSATAIEKNIVPFFKMLIPELKRQYTMAPIVVAEQARVAIGDSIAELLHAKMVVHFIGERPGLKSPDSLGIYMTYHPFWGITEDKRNCISNVRKDGLSYPLACSKLLYLISESFKRSISGVDLKDEQSVDAIDNEMGKESYELR